MSDPPRRKLQIQRKPAAPAPAAETTAPQQQQQQCSSLVAVTAAAAAEKKKKKRAPLSVAELRRLTERLEEDVAALLAAEDPSVRAHPSVRSLAADVAALRALVPPPPPPRPPCRAPLRGEVLFSVDFECYAPAVPCEVGLTAFTREQGEVGALHTLVNPGPFAMHPSVHFTIRLHGIRTADLPPPAPQPAAWLRDAVVAFVARFQNTPAELQPLLFAKGADCEEKCIAWMFANGQQQQQDPPSPSPLRVLDIEKGDGISTLNHKEVCELYRSLADNPVWHANTCCQFHARLSTSKHCALVDARAVQSVLIEDYNRSTAKASTPQPPPPPPSSSSS